MALDPTCNGTGRSTTAAPLGMLFFEVERRARRQGLPAARALLEHARARAPRVAQDPEYAGLAARVGVGG